MRLIDADELIKDRVENDPVRIAVKCAPTAFDKEKVIEEIKGIMDDESIRFVDQAVNRTIEIVEKGWNSCIDAITEKK